MPDLTWNWSEQSAEDGVVHESVANTDHNDSTKLKQGYSAANPPFPTNQLGWFPLHEDSGTTVYDFSGNNHDLTASGATPNVTGLLGDSAWSLDGTGDTITDGGRSGGDFPLSGSATINMWFKNDSTGQQVIAENGDVRFALVRDWNGTGYELKIYDGSNNNFVNSGVTTTGAWLMGTIRYDSTAGEGEIFINATSEGVASISTPAYEDNFDIGYRVNGPSDYFAGDVCMVGVWNRLLSDSEIQTLYDVVNTAGVWVSTSKVA